MSDPGNIIKRTSQYIDNISFDDSALLPMMELAGTDGVSVFKAPVTADGLSISTGLVPKIYDAITYTSTSATVDTYQYYKGGTSGTLVATLTITWTNSTKTILVSVVRT